MRHPCAAKVLMLKGEVWQLISVTPEHPRLKDSREKREDDEMILLMVQKWYLGEGRKHEV